MEKININEIIESSEFKKTIENKNIGEVFFYLLQNFVTQFNNDYNTQRELACHLFIYYLKYHKKQGTIDHVYEKALLNFVGFFSLSEDTFKFLLEQDIDLNFSGVNMYGTPVILKDSLALGLTKPNLMGKFLDILNAKQIEYFSNLNYDMYTDTVQMNIQAGRIEESITLFESTEYNLYPTDAFTNSNEERKFTNNVDRLTSLIKTTRCSLIPKVQKRAILNTILYNPKIKVINKESLSDLKEILTEEEYTRFISYITTKVQEGKIILYKVEKGTICFESSDSIKKLIYSKNN